MDAFGSMLAAGMVKNVVWVCLSMTGTGEWMHVGGVVEAREKNLPRRRGRVEVREEALGVKSIIRNAN